MPFVNNNGVKIYYVVDGKGEPIVMLHGGPGDHKEWNDYVNLLKDKYQLIRLDLRGNGRSDKPHDSPSYSTKNFTSDVIAVLNELKITKAICWGYSYGAFLVFCLSRDYPERFHSFIIGGMHASGLTKETQQMLQSARERLKDGADGLISLLKEKGDDITSEDEQKFRSWDYVAINKWLANEEQFCKVDDHLPNLDHNFLLYAGENDEWNPYPHLEEISKKMKKAKAILFENYGHEVHSVTKVILPHILEFLEKTKN